MWSFFASQKEEEDNGSTSGYVKWNGLLQHSFAGFPQKLYNFQLFTRCIVQMMQYSRINFQIKLCFGCCLDTCCVCSGVAHSSNESKLKCEIQNATWRAISTHQCQYFGINQHRLPRFAIMKVLCAVDWHQVTWFLDIEVLEFWRVTCYCLFMLLTRGIALCSYKKAKFFF